MITIATIVNMQIMRNNGRQDIRGNHGNQTALTIASNAITATMVTMVIRLITVTMVAMAL
jgi:hypothetical protein